MFLAPVIAPFSEEQSAGCQALPGAHGSLAARCVCPVQRGKGAGEESCPPSGFFRPEPLLWFSPHCIPEFSRLHVQEEIEMVKCPLVSVFYRRREPQIPLNLLWVWPSSYCKRELYCFESPIFIFGNSVSHLLFYSTEEASSLQSLNYLIVPAIGLVKKFLQF